MNCEQFQSMLSEYAAGSLPESDRILVEDHLQTGCLTCCQEFDEYAAALAQLSTSLTPITPSADLWERLEQRVRASGAPTPRPLWPVDPRDPDLSGRVTTRAVHWRTAIWSAVGGALATGIVVNLWVGQPLREQLQHQSHQIHNLSDHLQFANHSLGELRSAYLTRIELQSEVASSGDMGRDPSSPSAGSGFIIWDSYHRQFHCYLLDLPQLPSAAALTYTIWWQAADGETTLAGVFATTQGPDLATLITLPAGVELPAQLLITVESSGQPTERLGPVRFRGRFPLSSADEYSP